MAESAASSRAYLDHNATTALRPEALAAMSAALARCGNPSSVHAEGRAARAAVEAARDTVAHALGGDGATVVFAASGTEANALALAPGIVTGGAKAIVVGATEHACVRDGHRFPADAVRTAPVRGDGLIDLDALGATLDGIDGPALVAIQAANNETGVVQPICAIADLVHARGGVLHVDAVQAVGRMPVDLRAWGADSLALSAHKVGGPQGVGAVLFARAPGGALALTRGGGQERGLRAGTENVAGIVGFAAALAAAVADVPAEATRLSALRQGVEDALRAIAPQVLVVGADAPRLPNASCFVLPGLPAETALIAFDLAGVALSSGAACSSGKVGRSHVLAAMGLGPDEARCALRASLGWCSTQTDVIRFAQACETVLGTLCTPRSSQAA